MDRSKLYRLMGTCYNTSDFTPFGKHLSPSVIYESHDFLYKLKGRDRVMEYFAERTLANGERPEDKKHIAYGGFYKEPFLAGTRLAECIVICRPDHSPIRLVTLKIKRGKVCEITGLDPAANSFTRGPLIA